MRVSYTNKELINLLKNKGLFDIVASELFRYAEIIKDENYKNFNSYQRVTTFKKGRTLWTVEKVNGEIESITHKNILK